MEAGGHHVGVHELDEAHPGLDVDAGVPHAGVQADILNLAEEAEERVHLVPGGLGRDVGDLDHSGGLQLHGETDHDTDQLIKLGFLNKDLQVTMAFNLKYRCIVLTDG